MGTPQILGTNRFVTFDASAASTRLFCGVAEVVRKIVEMTVWMLCSSKVFFILGMSS